MISKWKTDSLKFTKYLFLNDIETIDGNPFLQKHVFKYLNYKNRRLRLEYFIWGNDFFISRCRNSKNIFVDGTYHYPATFTQLLIIMYYDDLLLRKIPVFYILMNNKSESAYNDIFKSVKEILSFGLNYKFNFDTITTDNEDALNNSINKNFPHTQRISCYFHYQQLIERNAKKEGLAKKELLEQTKLIINI